MNYFQNNKKDAKMMFFPFLEQTKIKNREFKERFLAKKFRKFGNC